MGFFYLVIYVFVSFGIAYVVGQSKISLPFRTLLYDSDLLPLQVLVDLLECPACLGFWIGFLTYSCKIYRPFPLADLVFAQLFWQSIAFAFFTAGVNFFLGALTGAAKTFSKDV